MTAGVDVTVQPKVGVFLQDEIDESRLEQAIWLGAAIGFFMLMIHVFFGQAGRASRSPKVVKVSIEIQRKSFHIIGGCFLAASYFYSIRFGLVTSACLAEATPSHDKIDSALAALALVFLTWLTDAARINFPKLSDWYLARFRGLVREKEFKQAAGMAYFTAGSLAAMLASPADTAILGILFLSLGDAAASLGTAAGSIPVGKSTRKVEGSIGCLVVCFLLSLFVGVAPFTALVAACLVSLGEVTAEVIGVDDNQVLPLFGVLGLRLARVPQFLMMFSVMAVGLCTILALGVAVAFTTSVRRGDPTGTPKKAT